MIPVNKQYLLFIKAFLMCQKIYIKRRVWERERERVCSFFLADVNQSNDFHFFVNEPYCSGVIEQRLSWALLFIQSHLMFSNRLPNVSSNQGWFDDLESLTSLGFWALAHRSGQGAHWGSTPCRRGEGVDGSCQSWGQLAILCFIANFKVT